MKGKPTEIIEKIVVLKDKLITLKAFFPAIDDSMVGQQDWENPGYYQMQGHRITFRLEEPLSKSKIDELNDISLWINDNYIVRLCALLEYHGIIPKDGHGKINKDLAGASSVDILRRLRREIIHGDGRYDDSKPEESKLYERIVNEFALDVKDASTAQRFPVPIDSFLVPLTEACIQYIRELAALSNDS